MEFKTARDCIIYLKGGEGAKEISQEGGHDGSQQGIQQKGQEVDQGRGQEGRRGEVPGADQLPSSSVDVLIAALSSIIQTAHFAQGVACNDTRLGKLSLGIYASAESGINNVEKKLFTLFGPALNMPCEVISENEQVGQDGVGNSRPDRMDENLRRDESTQRRVDTIHGSDMSRGSDIALAIENREVERNANIYSIPEGIAEKCVSYFTDASGFNAHSMNGKEPGFDSINAKIVVKAVKRIFKTYKENLVRRGVSVYGMQYGSLVPETIRKKQGLMPKVTLSRRVKGRSFSAEGQLQVKFTISKANRNRKEENLALVAALLHHQVHGIEVETVLKRFASNGFERDGCRVSQACSAARLGISCKYQEKELCCFYKELNGSKTKVGRGIRGMQQKDQL